MKELFSCHNTIGSRHSKSHISHKLLLNKDCKKIKILFEYAPKFIENDEKAEEIIYSIIDKQVIGDNKEIERKNWKSYKELKNLLTISIYDINGFRGCAHRQDKDQEHIISESEASPGLIEGNIPKGVLTIKVSVHALVTRECNYSIKVYDMEERNE